MSDAAIVLPWIAWRRYGDVEIIGRFWEAMNRYLDFILLNNSDYLWRNERSQDCGDWLALNEIEIDSTLPPTPKDLLATAYWARDANLLAEMAQAIGRMSDAERLRSLFIRVRLAFNIQHSAFIYLDEKLATEPVGEF